jgi:Xaa-Pro aminopeptidase
LTHSHLLKKGEVVPGIGADEFVQRRRDLMEKVAPGGVVVLMGAKIQYSSQSASLSCSALSSSVALPSADACTLGPTDILLFLFSELLPFVSPDADLPVDPSYKFRQQTDFMYLTGFNEPDSALILRESLCAFTAGCHAGL